MFSSSFVFLCVPSVGIKVAVTLASTSTDLTNASPSSAFPSAALSLSCLKALSTKMQPCDLVNLTAHSKYCACSSQSASAHASLVQDGKTIAEQAYQ